MKRSGNVDISSVQEAIDMRRLNLHLWVMNVLINHRQLTRRVLVLASRRPQATSIEPFD